MQCVVSGWLAPLSPIVYQTISNHLMPIKATRHYFRVIKTVCLIIPLQRFSFAIDYWLTSPITNQLTVWTAFDFI